MSAEPRPELVYTVVEPTDARRADLREQLLGMWVDVTNAGGAVGFTVPADVGAVATTLDAALDRVAAGTDVLGILRHQHTLATFSDSGAHVCQEMGFLLQTHLLNYWVRKRQAFTLEEALEKLN